MRVDGQHHAPAALPLGKDPVPIGQDAGWAPGPVWTGTENFTPHRDSIPGPSIRKRVAVPTELPRPTLQFVKLK